MSPDEEEAILRYYIGEKFIELFTFRRNYDNEHFVYYHTTAYKQGKNYKFKNTYHILLMNDAVIAYQWEGYPAVEKLRVPLADPDGVAALQDWIDSNVVKTSPNIRETLERLEND